MKRRGRCADAGTSRRAVRLARTGRSPGRITPARMRTMFKRWLSGLAVLALGAGLAGCQSQAANGALIGGATGAGVGAIIGHNSHNRTAEGALIGGAVGAVTGGLIGNEQDKADAREREAARN